MPEQVDVALKADGIAPNLLSAETGLYNPKLAESECKYVLKGVEELMEGPTGARPVYSEAFKLAGLSWYLNIDAQCLSTFKMKDGTEKAKTVSVFLTLRDVAMMTPEEMPFVDSTLSIVNHSTRSTEILAVLQIQYGRGPSAKEIQKHCSWRVGFIKHCDLRSQRSELWPEGDLHLVLRLAWRPVGDVAARLGKATPELLLTSSGAGSGAQAAALKGEEREEQAEWLAGGGAGGSAVAAAVRRAVARDAALCARIRSTREAVQYGRTADDFESVLHMLRNTLSCETATQAVLSHFGGADPPGAVVACLAADPAGLMRHISAAVAPQHAACAIGPASDARRGVTAVG